LAGSALAPLAGQNTAVSLGLNLLADFKMTIAIALTGSAAAWAMIERVLRQRKTKYLQDRIKQLEERLDPDRSSSELTRTGKTNPKDRRT
jgi:membrane protein implicated in regulation of membrane protease activity